VCASISRPKRVHFVSIQRTIEDFITIRNAMNASSAQLQNPSITDTVNNGINKFIVVKRPTTTSPLGRTAPSRCSPVASRPID